MRHEATISAATERRVLSLRWEIAPEAARRSSLGAVAAMNGEAEQITRAVLEWMVEGDEARAVVRLEVGEDDLEVEAGRARGTWVSDGEFEHGEFGGVLRVSVRGEQVVWARTELIGTLGLGGGVYDGPGAT